MNEGDTEFKNLETGDSAMVIMTPTKDMVCEVFCCAGHKLPIKTKIVKRV